MLHKILQKQSCTVSVYDSMHIAGSKPVSREFFPLFMVWHILNPPSQIINKGGLVLTLKGWESHETIISDILGAIEGPLSEMTTFICDFLPICLSNNKTNGPFSICILFLFKVCPPHLQRIVSWWYSFQKK